MTAPSPRVGIIVLLAALTDCTPEPTFVVKSGGSTQIRTHECYDSTEHGVWMKRTYIDASQILCRATLKGGGEVWGAEGIVKGEDVLDSECDRAWPPREDWIAEAIRRNSVVGHHTMGGAGPIGCHDYTSPGCKDE